MQKSLGPALHALGRDFMFSSRSRYVKLYKKLPFSTGDSIINIFAILCTLFGCAAENAVSTSLFLLVPDDGQHGQKRECWYLTPHPPTHPTPTHPTPTHPTPTRPTKTRSAKSRLKSSGFLEPRKNAEKTKSKRECWSFSAFSRRKREL